MNITEEIKDKVILYNWKHPDFLREFMHFIESHKIVDGHLKELDMDLSDYCDIMASLQADQESPVIKQANQIIKDLNKKEEI